MPSPRLAFVALPSHLLTSPPSDSISKLSTPTMAAINTSEILLELVALGDDLPSSTHATDLHSLLKQLIQATRAERAAAKQAMGDLQIKVEELAAANREHDRPSADATAAKKVTDLQAWHDEAAKQLASVERERDQALRELTEAMKQRDHARLELHTAQDTAVKLRAEVVHLEDIVKKQQQPLAQPADGTRNVVDSPRNGGKYRTYLLYFDTTDHIKAISMSAAPRPSAILASYPLPPTPPA